MGQPIPVVFIYVQRRDIKLYDPVVLISGPQFREARLICFPQACKLYWLWKNIWHKLTYWKNRARRQLFLTLECWYNRSAGGYRIESIYLHRCDCKQIVFSERNGSWRLCHNLKVKQIIQINLGTPQSLHSTKYYSGMPTNEVSCSPDFI